jgi:hypothetical protein
MELAETSVGAPPTGGQLLALVDALRDGTLNEGRRKTAHVLRLGILVLTERFQRKREAQTLQSNWFTTNLPGLQASLIT